MENPEFKICPKCGKAFECLHNENCWCLGYEVSPENLEILRKEYENCLCPDCLSDYGKKKENLIN